MDDAATCLIPIILISGQGDPSVVRRSRLAGCRYFVRKPYDPSALLLLARTAMEDQFRNYE
jgi:FixJ family two-component response regulator